MIKRDRTYDRHTARIFWQASKKYKRELIAVAMYPLGTIAISTVVPLYVGKILAALARPGVDIKPLVFGFIIAAAIGLVLNRYGFAAMMTFQAKTSIYLQNKVMSTLLNRSVGFHNNNISGKIVSDAIDFSSAFIEVTNVIFVNALPFVVTLISGLVIVTSASLILGLIVAIMAAFTIISSWYDSRRRSNLRQRRQVAQRAATGHLADTIVNVQTVKTFAGEQKELAESRRLNKILLGMRVHDWTLSATKGNDKMIGLMILQLVYILLITAEVHRNPALLGIGIFAFSMTITISNRLFEVTAMMRNSEEALFKAAPMTEIMLQEPEVVDVTNAPELKVAKGLVNVEDVNFQYEDAKEKDVFENLSLTIQPGEKVGLVGPSGGGKSTLTRLLLRFEDISGGAINIDGQDISKVQQASLRRAISYVPQEPLLFHRTIKENIGYGQDNASPKAIAKAAKLANADEFINNLPNKYETIVGERGVKLSGGQRQRVAIARAMLKNAPILILDEATSALDSESERLIQEALWKLMEGRTTIVIAHRLSTIQHMDRIVVLDKGQIIEQGSHEDLLKQNGLYAKLWKHQSGGFLKD